MIKEYDPNSELVSIWNDNSSTPKYYRYYFCDNETLYEEGGFTDMLKDLQPTFDSAPISTHCSPKAMQPGLSGVYALSFFSWDKKEQFISNMTATRIR